MNFRRTPALILAGFIALSTLAACGQAPQSSSAESSASTVAESPAADSSAESTAMEGSAADGDIMTPYGKYPETIEMHTAKITSTAPNFVEGENAADNAMTRYIEDQVNVKTIIDWEASSTDYPNKLSLMVASNTIPDMFTLGANDYLLYRQLVENDMLADLSESLEKCANDHIKGTFASFSNENLEPFTEGDKLYGIAGGMYGYEHNLLWLRKDWMDECGIKETPKTVDDLKNLLKAFKEKNPGGDNQGLTLNAKDIGGGYSVTASADPIFEAFGATPKTWIEDKDGKVIYGSVAPEMKEGLKTLAEWYAEGLIDPQFATRTTDGATIALFNGSQSGAIFAPWWFSYSMSELPKKDPKAEPIPVNAPLDADGKYNVVWPRPAGAAAVVSKNYANPEALFKVFNCEFDMWLGLKEDAAKLIQPNRDAGVDWVYLFPTGGVNFTYADIVPNVGLLAKNLIENGKEEGAASATEQDRIMARSAKEYADTKSLEGTGWVEYHGRYLASNIVNAPEINIIKPAFSYATDSMADLKPNLDTLEQTTFLKIVTGELPVDAFDDFVKEWYAQGGQTMTDEVNAMAAK